MGLGVLCMTPLSFAMDQEMVEAEDSLNPTQDDSIPPENAEEGSRGPASVFNSDKEYSFKWLDPDKKIYVLQNRKYTKSRRLALSLMGGINVSGAPYRDVYMLDGRAAFYLSESIGFEVFYARYFNFANNTFNALSDAVGNLPVLPVIREINASYGFLLHWAPWYSKINIFNFILYFDWYFAAGVGRLDTEIDTRKYTYDSPNLKSEQLWSFSVATGHQYHLSQIFAVRLEILGTFFRAPAFGDEGADTTFSIWNFNLGLTTRL